MCFDEGATVQKELGGKQIISYIPNTKDQHITQHIDVNGYFDNIWSTEILIGVQSGSNVPVTQTI